MGMDELEDAKSGEGETTAAQPQSGPPASEEEERNQRVDAAKAFFRAMYAGEEPPASFGQPQEGKGDTSTSTVCRNCESMEILVKEAEAKTAEAETLYKRMAADFDNYRRRMERQSEEAVSMGVKKAAEALVPALDDLDRAMLYLNPELPAEKVIESFKLVGTRILSCMEQIGLKPIQAVGELFDPKFHEPVQQIETTEHADGEVMSELRRGWVLHDKVVRPALVNVASNSTGVVTKPGATAEAAPDAQPEQTEVAAASNPGPSAEAIEEAQPAIEDVLEAPPSPEASDEEAKVYDLGDIPDV
jgi:molecular chaperone GrpE